MKRITMHIPLVLVVLLGVWTHATAQYSEAPALAAQVEAGQLPPVTERLPAEPMVIEPWQEIGRHGGELRVFKTSGDNYTVMRNVGYEPLLRWTSQTGYDVPEPNLAHSWDISEDFTEFIFYLREGIRWSDGHPFTADDIIFWYEAILLNTELTPAIPSLWVRDSEPVVITKLDDYTVKFVFDGPFGTFLFHAAQALQEDADMLMPRHYLEQFHVDYADPDELAARVRDAGLEFWYELFDFHLNWYTDINRPVLHPWMLASPRGGDTLLATRNPYYWKVDPAGNQLPYADSVRFTIQPDAQVATIQALAGQFDILPRYVNTTANLPLFAENQERGNYRLATLRADSSNVAAFHFNMTHEDPVKREIFRNPQFRIALSHALDREAIIDLVYLDLGRPSQASPLEDSAFYHEGHATAYLEYDPDLANQLLDEIGLDQRDSAGWRLMPDGRRMEVLLETSSDSMPEYADLFELMADYWQAVGVFATPRMRSISGHVELVNANRHDTGTWHGIGGGLVIGRFAHYFPEAGGWSAMGPLWGVWYNSGGQGGEEPPEDIKRLFDLRDEVMSTADPEEQARIMREVFDLHQENLYVIGISRWPPGYAIVHNRVRNVPDWWWDGAQPPHPAQFMAQLWIDE